MKFAENPKKVDNIVEANFDEFRRLYDGAIERYCAGRRYSKLHVMADARENQKFKTFKVCVRVRAALIICPC
jgi:hypothetical protein